MLILDEFFIHGGRKAMVPDYLFISDEMNVGWCREEVVVVGRVPELVVSQDQVPPRVGRGVGSAGVEQVTEHLYIILVSSLVNTFLWKKRTSPGWVSTKTGSSRRWRMAEKRSMSTEAKSPFRL